MSTCIHVLLANVLFMLSEFIFFAHGYSRVVLIVCHLGGQNVFNMTLASWAVGLVARSLYGFHGQ